MPTTRRNTRKRQKDEMDETNDDHGHDTANNQPDASANPVETTAKKRKLESSPSIPPSSSSLVITDAPATSTSVAAQPSTSRKRRRAKREGSGSAAPAPAPAPVPSASTRKRSKVKKEESAQPDELLTGSAESEETPIEPEGPANNTTVKLEEEEEADAEQSETTKNVKMEHVDEGSDKENETEEPATKRLTAKEKGKARAVDPPEDEPEDKPELQADHTSHSHAHDHAKLQEELAKLRAELQSATATLETQSKALEAVTAAFTCNVCLESLQNPLGLACGHVFCQDDLWNWFHRVGEDSDEDGTHSGSSLSPSDDEDDDDEGSISDGFTASDSDSSSVVIQRPAQAFTLEEREARFRLHRIAHERRRAELAERRTERLRRAHERARERDRTVIQVDDDYNTSDDDDDDDDDLQEGGSIRRAVQPRALSRLRPPGEAPRRRSRSPLLEEDSESDTLLVRPTVRGGTGRVTPHAARKSSTHPSPPAAPSHMAGPSRTGEGASHSRPIPSNDGLRARKSSTYPSHIASDDAITAAPRSAGPPLRPSSTRASANRAGPLQDIWNPRSTTTIPDDRPGRRRGPAGRADEPISVPDTDEETARSAAGHTMSAAAPAAREAVAGAAAPTAGPSNPPSTSAAAGPETATTATPAAPTSRRIPARAHPNRRNLTCPQCRVKIVIPPFPIFVIRELANVMRAHDAGRRQASMERENERETMNDPTWGGLFPRNASAGTYRPRLPPPGNEEDEADGSSRLEDLFREGRPEDRPRFRTGEERRQDNEYDRLVLRMRQRQVQRTQEDIMNNRRQRVIRGRPPTPAERNAEVLIRAREDRQLMLLRHSLEVAHREVARDGAEAHRERNVLSRGMRDAEDGVRRCIDCGWEIEDGRCEHCGATYDSDSEFDDNGEDIGGTSPPPPAGFIEEDEADLSDIVPDSENILPNQSQDYQDDGDEEESAMDTEDDIARPAGGTARLHPFSSEEDENEGEEEEEGEDLFGDTSAPATDDTLDNPSRRQHVDEEEDEDTGEETEGHIGPSRSRTAAPARRKRSQFMYDSEDDEDDEELAAAEEEERQAGFIDDDASGLIGHELDEEDESEAESTDRETRRARKEQRRMAREAAAVSRQNGNGRDSESEFTGSESPSTSEEDQEEDGEDQSLPTSVTSPPSKHEDDDEDDGIEEIASQDFLRSNRSRNGLTPAQAAARAAMARQDQNNQAITDVYNRLVGDKQKKAAATQQQHAGPSRLGNVAASSSKAPPVYKKRVIEESEEE